MKICLVGSSGGHLTHLYCSATFYFSLKVAIYDELISALEDIEKLGEIIKDYDKLSAGMHGGGMDNNAKFCAKFEEMADELVGEGKK